MKATHSVSFKPLKVNKRRKGLQGQLLCSVLWGLGLSQLDLSESDACF